MHMQMQRVSGLNLNNYIQTSGVIIYAELDLVRVCALDRFGADSCHFNYEELNSNTYNYIEFGVIIYAFVRVKSGARSGQGLERTSAGLMSKYIKIHVTLIMSIYQNLDIYTKKFIALIETIFSIMTKIQIYFYNYILQYTTTFFLQFIALNIFSI